MTDALNKVFNREHFKGELIARGGGFLVQRSIRGCAAEMMGLKISLLI